MRNPSSGTKTPCCSKVGIKKGPWTPEEDEVLSNYIKREGEGRWRTLPKRAGLQRCGKSCRLRWMNYLRPSVKRGRIAPDEEDLILRLHRLLGNRWSLIAGRIPGRTDNEIKNYWNTHLSKKLISQGIDPRTHKPLNPVPDSSETGHDHLASSSNPNPNPRSIQTEETRGSNQATAAKSIENFTTNIHHYQTHAVDNDMAPIEGFMMGLPSNVHADINQQENNYIDQNCNDQDTFSSFLDSLINDNVFVNQQPHTIISPSFHPIVSSAQTFNSTPHHDNMIWEAEVVATTMVGLDNDHQQCSLNNHLA